MSLHKIFPRLFVSKLKGSSMQGVFTFEDIPKGEVIHKLKGKIAIHPTRTSVQLAKNKHIEDTLTAFMNHSCTPNAEVYHGALISLKEIKAGEEITFNYNANEDTVSCPFICNCCGKEILGRLSYKLFLLTSLNLNNKKGFLNKVFQ